MVYVAEIDPISPVADQSLLLSGESHLALHSSSFGIELVLPQKAHLDDCIELYERQNL
jgi:hypothetical protein